MKVTFLDEHDLHGIPGSVRFLDQSGNVLAQNSIPVGGATVSDTAVDKSASVYFISPGYFDQQYPTTDVQQHSTIEVQFYKKPDTLLHYFIGAVAGYLFAKIFEV